MPGPLACGSPLTWACSSAAQAGGRVVFFLPSHPSCPDITPLLPTHPCLSIVDASRQPLNSGLDRWLVTIRKVWFPRGPHCKALLSCAADSDTLLESGLADESVPGA